MSGNSGGFGSLVQQAIAQLPYNMQNYVGGPSYPGMQTGSQPGNTGAMPQQQGQAQTAGAYNQMTNDMRQGYMGQGRYGPGMGMGGGFGFGYNPYQPPQQSFNPWMQGQQPWMGGQPQGWGSGNSWQQMPQQTNPMYGGQQYQLPYAPMNRATPTTKADYLSPLQQQYRNFRSQQQAYSGPRLL